MLINNTVIVQTETVNLMLDMSIVKSIVVSEDSCYVHVFTFTDDRDLIIKALDHKEAKLIFNKISKEVKDFQTEKSKTLDDIVNTVMNGLNDGNE